MEENPYFYVPNPADGNVKIKAEIDREEIAQKANTNNAVIKLTVIEKKYWKYSNGNKFEKFLKTYFF